MAVMTRDDSTIPPGMYLPTADQRVVMYASTWADYQTQLALRGERSRPKLAYLDGVIELMSTSRDHERINWRIGRILEAYMLEVGIEGGGYGEWTLGHEDLEAGGEPDECYVFGPRPDAKPIPDLVIEVNWSRGGINKLEIDRRIGVPEVWFWEDNRISVHVLSPRRPRDRRKERRYVVRTRSTFVPDLDLAWVCELIPRADTIQKIHRAVRAAFRSVR